MRNRSWLCLLVACAALIGCGVATPVSAQDENRGGPGDRLDRLERRLNELAQRQERFMQEVGGRLERRGPMPMPGPEGLRPPLAPPGPPGPPPGPPAPAVAKALHGLGGLVRLLILVGIVLNILLAVWIYTDIRKRGEGSGIFIALALLAGVPSAIIYAIVRIGDRKGP